MPIQGFLLYQFPFSVLAKRFSYQSISPLLLLITPKHLSHSFQLRTLLPLAIRRFLLNLHILLLHTYDPSYQNSTSSINKGKEYRS
jgi:hypothetical protein